MRILVVTPHFSAEPTPHCARINDVLRHLKLIEPNIKIEILSISDLPESRFQVVKLFSFLRRFVSKVKQVDVVHFVSFPPIFILLRLMSLSKPVVIGPNITGSSFPRKFLGRPALDALAVEKPLHWIRWYFFGGAIKESINVRLMAGSKTVISLSEYAADIISSRGYPREKIKVLPFAVPEQLSISPLAQHIIEEIKQTAHPRIAYVGRLDRRKGFDVFLSILRTRSSTGSFHVFGEGALASEVAPLAIQDKEVLLHKKLSRSDLLAVICLMDVYVQPSTYEAIATTLLEALKYGVPVLSANIPSHVEASRSLGGVTMFESGDSDSACEKLEGIVANLEAKKQDAREASRLLNMQFTSDWLLSVYSNATRKD